jgi:hypothetical protein
MTQAKPIVKPVVMDSVEVSATQRGRGCVVPLGSCGAGWYLQPAVKHFPKAGAMQDSAGAGARVTASPIVAYDLHTGDVAGLLVGHYDAPSAATYRHATQEVISAGVDGAVLRWTPTVLPDRSDMVPCA